MFGGILKMFHSPIRNTTRAWRRVIFRWQNRSSTCSSRLKVSTNRTCFSGTKCIFQQKENIFREQASFLRVSSTGSSCFSDKTVQTILQDSCELIFLNIPIFSSPSTQRNMTKH